MQRVFQIVNWVVIAVLSGTGLLSGTPFALANSNTAQSRVENRSFYSNLLQREMPYMVYLPEGYSESSKNYPVLYMLHGNGGKHTEWASDLDLFVSADRLIAAGEITPMIIVLPQGDRDYWVDHVEGLPWGQYVAREVVSEIDRTYRTLTSPPGRAIGGLSMGGHGSLQIGMNYPDVFGVIGAHSPTIRTQADAPDYFGTGAAFAARDPLSLAASRTTIYNQKIWVDIGSGDDQWIAQATRLHEILQSRNVPHTWNVFSGIHVSSYWKLGGPAYLRWYSAALAEPQGVPQTGQRQVAEVARSGNCPTEAGSYRSLPVYLQQPGILSRSYSGRTSTE